MTNLVLAATLAISPADWTQLTNRVDLMWTAHTQRVERIERARENARKRREGPPDRPFRVKGGRR